MEYDHVMTCSLYVASRCSVRCCGAESKESPHVRQRVRSAFPVLIQSPNAVYHSHSHTHTVLLPVTPSRTSAPPLSPPPSPPSPTGTRAPFSTSARHATMKTTLALSPQTLRWGSMATVSTSSSPGASWGTATSCFAPLSCPASTSGALNRGKTFTSKCSSVSGETGVQCGAGGVGGREKRGGGREREEKVVGLSGYRESK